MTSASFHPAVAGWFNERFAAPTPAQADAWPAIMAGQNVLIAAPTGSGKTLAAFLGAIDALVRQGVEQGLKDETQVVYVSPLKALSNDIQRNLEAPLAGIREVIAENKGCLSSPSVPGSAPGIRRRLSGNAIIERRRISWSPRRSRFTSCLALRRAEPCSSRPAP